MDVLFYNDTLDDLADALTDQAELDTLHGLPIPTDNNGIIDKTGRQPDKCIKFRGGISWIT